MLTYLPKERKNTTNNGGDGGWSRSYSQHCASLVLYEIFIVRHKLILCLPVVAIKRKTNLSSRLHVWLLDRLLD